MKAISLTQPWASLVAVGAKRIETRSWRTSYRGPLAIHAAMGLPSPPLPEKGKRGLWQQIEREPFASVLRERLSGYTLAEIEEQLPRGMIVAVCTLDAILSTVQVTAGQPSVEETYERAFGDYSPGRWAWFLRDVEKLDPPVECKGGRGVWPVPRDCQRAIEAQLYYDSDIGWRPTGARDYARDQAPWSE